MTLSSTLPETRSRTVTLDPAAVLAWHNRLGAIVNHGNRLDRRHADAINDIRSRLCAIAACVGPVTIAAWEPLSWATSLMLTAQKIGAHEVATVLHAVGNDIAEAAGTAVAK
jgi:hypothetical protein